ncbi:parallel beta helix pectate lyase-like protein/pectate lyase-like protein [Cytobacillus horneckiae]|uniref:right-handed parallel beta-helix repeat-containing protein n=1 Tax=Cytobacillus horneckiae TaxID=549687 RepID=UPI0019D22F72|nr:right-handed parallel beta-helix repeat-containing protein [Cytobacillus horneckiae]MBN6889893.1 right-handed parallel beta-helix repeat-containing protein [Cytobacillus horneckiae]
MAKMHVLGNKFDREYRNNLNENFNNLANDMNNFIENVSEDAFDKVVDAAKLEWLPPVNTFSDLSTNYPDATIGKTSWVRDSGKTYRYNGSSWIEIQDFIPDAINEVDYRLSAEIKEISINVKTLGAIGDGVYDDTLAIQSALDTAKEVGQVNIIIPAGEYKVTKKLIIYKNTNIKMSSSTTIKRSHNASILQNGENGSVYYGYEGNGNILIEGGILDGNLGEYNFECSGFSVSHAQNIIIRDVTFKDMYAGHALDLAGVKDVIIDNCKFIGYRDRPDNSRNYAEAIQIDVASANGFPVFGAHDGTYTQNVTVRSCYFGPSGTENTTSWPVGVGHHAAVHNIWPTDIMILNNVFEECTFRAIRLFKLNNVIIEGNIFRACMAAVNIATPTANTENTKDINGEQSGVSQPGDSVIIKSNVIENVVGTVATISINGVTGVYTKNIKITGNIFKNTTSNIDTCIYVNYGESIEVTNNKFEETTRLIWALNSMKIRVSRNECRSSNLEMVYIQNSHDVLTEQNTVGRVGRHGIYYSNINGGNISFNEIKDSSFESPGARNGIFVASSSQNIDVINNKLLSAMNLYGIQVSNTCMNIFLSNNNAQGTSGSVSIPSSSGFDGLILTNPSGAQFRATLNSSGQIVINSF